VRYPLPLPNRRNASDVGVELSEPPAGITLVRVIRESTSLVMLIAADAEMAKPGLQGNLILNVFAERMVPGRNGRPATKRRVLSALSQPCRSRLLNGPVKQVFRSRSGGTASQPYAVKHC